MSVADVGEYDRMYSLLTKEFGKVRAIVRSVRRPAAKLAGHLDIPNKSWVQLVPTSRGWQVTQALERESFPAARRDRVALAALLANARFMDMFSQETHDQELFGLWQEFLVHLEGAAGGDSRDTEFIAAQFRIRALSVFGFLPDLRVCSSCENQLQDEHAFLFMHGVWCHACSVRQHVHGLQVSISALREAGKIAQGAWLDKNLPSADMSEIANHFERQARQYMV